MTTVVVLFLFCSGIFHFTFASNRLRIFRSPNKGVKGWDLSECDQPGETFVTLYDEEDSAFVKKIVNQTTWLGLRKGRNLTWSDGASVTFSRSSVTLTDGQQICEAIDNNTWKGFYCSEKKYFMCYAGNKYKLSKSQKNWCQALQDCRKHHGDLVSISNETQNDEVIRNGNGASFWIGLMHDDWEWTSKSCSTFRKWEGNRASSAHNNCTVVEYNADVWLLYQYQCTSVAQILCSKGGARIKVIDKKLPWEEAFTYCKDRHTGLLWIDDKKDQDAVEQWLRHRDRSVEGPFWIGMRQSRVFGFWIWSDRMVSHNNWKNGTQPELQMFHQCGVISEKDYTWSAENCLVPHNFLCEEEIVSMKNGIGG